MRLAGSVRSAVRDTEGWYASLALANLALGTSSTLVPLLIAHVLGGSVSEVGLQSSAVSLVGILGNLTWGRLADVAPRRKPFLLVAFFVLTLTFAGIAFAQSFWALVVYGMIQNFFWVATAAVSVLLLTERSGESAWERRIGKLNQTGALGWLAGLALGSAALGAVGGVVEQETAMRGLFLVLSLASLGALVVALRFLPHPEGEPRSSSFHGVALALGALLTEVSQLTPYRLVRRLDPRRRPSRAPADLASRRGIQMLLVETLLAFAGVGFFAIPLPLLLAQRFAVPSSEVFLHFVVLNVGVIVAYPLASRRIGRMGNRTVQAGALAARLGLFGLASAYLFLFASAPPSLVIALHLLTLGLTWPFLQLSGVALASRLAPGERRGQVLGRYNAAAGMGWVLAGVGSGYVAETVGYAASFAVAAFLLALALLVLRLVPNPAPSREREESAEGRETPRP